MAKNTDGFQEYRMLPEHRSHAEYTPLNPDISFFQESSVTAREENIFQGTVPPGEEENPYLRARAERKKKKRFLFLQQSLGAAVRAGAAVLAILLAVGLILLHRDAAASQTEAGAKIAEKLEEVRRPVYTGHKDYGPDAFAGLWNGDPFAPHKYDAAHPVVVKEAGCTEDGERDYICSECGITLKEILPAKGHDPAEKVRENETAGDCRTYGSAEEVIYCRVCGEELSREAVTSARGAHVTGEVTEENRVEAACTDKGSYDIVRYCRLCGEEISRETVVLEATGHTEGEAVVENETAAACTEDGAYDLVIYCDVCGEELSRETAVLKAAGHTEGEAVVENETAATCTEDGAYDLVVYCDVCGEELSRETAVLEATGHTEGEEVHEHDREATCLAEGGYDLVKYCDVCGEELSRRSVTVPKTDHTRAAAVRENERAANCTAAGSYDSVVYCSACHTELSRTTTAVNALGHNYTARTTAATCTARGYTTHTCSRCGDSYTDTYTAALGHSFNNTASSTCTRCGTRALTFSYNASINGFNYTIHSDFAAEVQRLSAYIAGAVVVDTEDSSTFNSVEIDPSLSLSGQIHPAANAPVSGHRYEMRMYCGTKTVIYSNAVTVP